MTRRDFILTTTSAAAGLPTLARAATSGTNAAIPAIDTHVHLYDPTRPQGVPWPTKTDALLYRPYLSADFRRTVAGLPVVGTVVVEASEWVEDNAWILDLAKTAPEIVGFVGNLRPGQPDFATHLRRFAANPLFRGLRLRAADLKNFRDPAIAADLARLVEADLSIDALGGAAILGPAEQAAARYPTLRIVMDHLPFKDWDGDPAAMRSALKPLAARPNVFLKISEVVRRVNNAVVTDAAFYRPGLDALLDLFGPDRVLFGSNWPVSERVASYAELHQVVRDYFETKSRAVAEKYFWRNALTAYRWQPRGAAADLLR